MRNQGKNKTPEWTILKLLRWTTEYFQKHRIESPRTGAEILLAHTLNCQRLDLYLQYDKPLDADELARFKGFIRRRLAREPVAYIEGRKGFWKQVLEVSQEVLIPRPETECLVETALSVIPANPSSKADSAPWRILELGVGSGAITLALMDERPHHFYWASDASLKALDLARRNIHALHSKADIQLVAADWLEPFAPEPNFDLMISNPPYIPTDQIKALQPEICQYEPRIALDGGADGLNAIGCILQKARRCLKPCGEVMLEIGHDQKEAVRAMAQDGGGYDQIEFIKDDNGHHRVVRMRRAP